MTPQDQKAVQNGLSAFALSSDGPVIHFDTGLDKKQNDHFKGFCDSFVRLMPQLRVHRDGGYSQEIPGFRVGRHGNITFHMIPTGKWLTFFLDAISDRKHVGPDPSSRYATKLTQLQMPLTLTLFVSHHCPHCPQLIRHLLPLAQSNPLLRLLVLDAETFKEMAQQKQVRAVPTLIMEDQFRWTGNMDPGEILDLAIQRDPARLSPSSLRQFLESGRAAEVAAMMIEHKKIFPALIDLLTDEKWPTRLAAMVTVECLAEDAQAIARELVAPLWDRFSDCSAPVKGDLTYVLGVIGSDSAKQILHAIAAHESDTQVREAAMEALEKDD
jgi:thiol-disulfide isomerase/thioredoxin